MPLTSSRSLTHLQHNHMITASTPLHGVLINLRKHIHALLIEMMMSFCIWCQMTLTVIDEYKRNEIMGRWKDEKIFDTVVKAKDYGLFTYVIFVRFNTVNFFPK